MRLEPTIAARSPSDSPALTRISRIRAGAGSVLAATLPMIFMSASSVTGDRLSLRRCDAPRCSGLHLATGSNPLRVAIKVRGFIRPFSRVKSAYSGKSRKVVLISPVDNEGLTCIMLGMPKRTPAQSARAKDFALAHLDDVDGLEQVVGKVGENRPTSARARRPLYTFRELLSEEWYETADHNRRLRLRPDYDDPEYLLEVTIADIRSEMGPWAIKITGLTKPVPAEAWRAVNPHQLYVDGLREMTTVLLGAEGESQVFDVHYNASGEIQSEVHRGAWLARDRWREETGRRLEIKENARPGAGRPKGPTEAATFYEAVAVAWRDSERAAPTRGMSRRGYVAWAMRKEGFKNFRANDKTVQGWLRTAEKCGSLTPEERQAGRPRRPPRRRTP